jgi:hypothetical protein
MVSFGISRVVTVNGVLLSSTSFQLPDLGRVTAAQIAAFERYLGSTSVVQVGGGNTAPTAPRTAARCRHGQRCQRFGQRRQYQYAVRPCGQQQGAPAQRRQREPVPRSASPATVVQNTLNDQSIQTRTVIDATTNALSLARGANTAAALRDALTRAVPGR